MNSRERVKAALNHTEPDRTPVDFGGTPCSGISAGALERLRKAYGLPEIPVKVHEPFQMLGFVDDDVIEKTGSDVIGLWPQRTFMGYTNDSWKDWQLFDGTKVLVGQGFEVDKTEEGGYILYPQGDRSAPPSAKMPKDGYYFDIIFRQEPVDENDMDGRRDFKDQFAVMQDEELKMYEEKAKNLFDNTDLAIIGGQIFLSIGDASVVPGPGMKRTPGIRKLDDWYMAHLLYPNYIKEVYSYQMEVGLKNLALYKEAVGDRIESVIVSGTDFGTQRGEFMSNDMFREFYKPYFKEVNDWIHTNTNWKTFYHCCGSFVNLLDDFVEMGADIINPVQCSAKGMDPVMLKEKYGNKLIFWGGAVDVQHTFPFGTPEEVYEQTQERMKIFSKGGGFICACIHNIQANVPTENVVAFFDAIRDFNE